MSVNSVNSTTGSMQEVQSGQASAFKQRRQDFQSLAKALDSNDLAGAQAAFAALQKDLQAVPQGSSAQQGGQSTIKDGINAIGAALSAGDLSGAQKALAQVKQDMQAQAGKARHGHHGHRHHGAGAQSDTAATSGTASQSADTGTAQAASIKITA